MSLLDTLASMAGGGQQGGSASLLPALIEQLSKYPGGLSGLIASFHTILYAQGRQIYSLSRAGYFPTLLSITHSKYRTPYVANITGAIVGLAVMLVIWFSLGAEEGGSII
ncbi:amino acid ABC transporter permease, partial [Burkholderia sp. SIMBA_013]